MWELGKLCAGEETGLTLLMAWSVCLWLRDLEFNVQSWLKM